MHLRPGVAWTPGTATHPTQFLVRDARVAMLLRDMLAEAQANAPSGRAYAQALSAALALHLNARYAPAAGPGTRLAPEISDLLRAHVRAHLAEELPVADLAAMARLSVSRFSELFRGSFHCAPHQYVVGQRVREAMRLLAEGRLSLAEVAQATGFADQSHLTRSFRRLADTTPGRYRAHARGAARLVQRGAGARAAPRDSWTPLGKPLRSP
jgi:AraC family transcriptional regulator